ncbi:PREDICTED: shugoshin-1-like isoform X3 [Nelumbo nucifera]|uniref:Shugoshin-1-like isoform X3 n=1 Tax=Nelumbo nucifera TaxID=4432 RepID=A0A1U8AME1_NELNU|nr:PREDICTED: shugoshin-1-like isoform X3 [Nelumbo nucifera]
MEDFFSLDSENCELTENTKGVNMVKKSLGSVVKKRLSDITNFQNRVSSPGQDDKPIPISSVTKDYIDKLRKENAVLMRLLQDRNKIIELSGFELQKLRMNLRKLQQQNWQLAQANSQMLAELNLGRDRLKAMQHELGCKEALLKAKNSELEYKTCQKTSNEESTVKRAEAAEESLQDKDDNKTSNPTRRRQSRIQSAGPAGTQVASKEKDDNKSRLCLRRQSTRFRQLEPTEDLFEIEDVKFPVHPLLDDQIHDDIPISSNSPTTKEEAERKSAPKEELRRSSVGRPLRRAVEKVQSYKERPVKIKLRRSE